jgi:hypothetical protein
MSPILGTVQQIAFTYFLQQKNYNKEVNFRIIFHVQTERETAAMKLQYTSQNTIYK